MSVSLIMLNTIHLICILLLGLHDMINILLFYKGFSGLICLLMQEWLEKSPSFAVEPKNISGLESLVLLVKCLKIMENATFLSNDNQVLYFSRF